MIEAYPTITNILGHEEISPGRKQDPGPAFPLDKLRRMLIESREENDQPYENMEGYVDVNQLNIRELPSIEADLASAPLERGSTLKYRHPATPHNTTKKQITSAKKGNNSNRT